MDRIKQKIYIDDETRNDEAQSNGDDSPCPPSPGFGIETCSGTGAFSALYDIYIYIYIYV